MIKLGDMPASAQQGALRAELLSASHSSPHHGCGHAPLCFWLPQQSHLPTAVHKLSVCIRNTQGVTTQGAGHHPQFLVQRASNWAGERAFSEKLSSEAGLGTVF